MMFRTLLAASLAALAVATPAQAGTISVEGGVLKVEAPDMVEFEAYQEGSDFTVYDYAESLDAGDGCAAEPVLPLIGSSAGTTYTCSGVTSVSATVTNPGGSFMFFESGVPVRFTGGPGEDYLAAYGAGAVEATGGAGDDRLGGGQANDVLDGGDGGDHLSDGPGVDRLTGGAGDDSLSGDAAEGECCFEEPGQAPPPPTPTGTADVLDGGAGKDEFYGMEPGDVLTGGDGRDRAYYFTAPPTVTLGAGGLDVESVGFERGDSVVRGDARVNEITTGEGKDDVDPGAGFDTVETGKGDDRVNSRDGFPDLISCGDGADAVVADSHDEVESNCESVDRAAVAPAAGTPGAAPSAIAPADLKITQRRRGRKLVIKGKLVLPAGAPASLCTGGGITLKAGRRTIGTVLNAKCAFTVKLKGRRKVKVKAFFAGTPGLAPISR